MRNSSYERVLKDAVDRMLADKPLRVPVGTKISQLSVIEESGLSKSVISTIRRSYPEIINLIVSAQKKQISTKNAHTLIVLADYFAALDRLVTNTPKLVYKGSKINVLNVTLEAGKAVGSIRPTRLNNLPIIEAIKEAQERQQKGLISNKNEIRLLEALERIKKGETRVVSRTSKPTQNAVAIEAGLCIKYISSNKAELVGVISKIKEAKQSYQMAC